MKISAQDRDRELVAQMRGGDGEVEKLCYAFSPMPEGGKMFAELRFMPGCSIGTHRHTGEYEVFFCREGELLLNDNGTERTLRPGDCALCRDGELHGIANRSDKPASVFAVIIKTNGEAQA